ncbi:MULTISPECIES: tRNA lysidine(34) synthetase TilS [Amycolatopsis]|uniref:tRNA(Ile)-lysidine synthase n=2 Tax=Amycolatopsis TaxID=1813 RepID=A0A1I4CB56_9PSEU|nr:tRNA lysidine(34) synthetase TilS [Amycolatopsis sacchari]SFK77396.1 tRNA(Ile)-lysidine synthase [Amycolatopsis sacchari]
MSTAEALIPVRRAVRGFLAAHPRVDFDVAVSGGADSLALAEAAAHEGHKLGLRVRALVVDHGLQPGSGRVAREAAEAARGLGVDEAEVLPVEVTGAGGVEAAARRARYSALRSKGRGLVLLGHTRDDQAETVLLGLGRGSGPRSIAGMKPFDPPWGRPLLDVPRAATRAACAALGVEPWEDPFNTDPRFTRVRLRAEVLPLLEDVLSGGVAAALARTATQLREDLETLDALAGEFRTDEETLDAKELEPVPPALRRRVLRRWLLGRGACDLSDGHLRAVDALVGEWRGQGGVWVPGGLVVVRTHGRLSMNRREAARGE